MPRLSGNGIRLTGAQLRAARGLLDLSAEALAAEAKLSLKTIRRAEQTHGPVHITAANAERIITILEGRGVRFESSDDEQGAGVRLRLVPPPKYGDQT